MKKFLLAAIILVIVGAGGWFTYNQLKTNNQQNQTLNNKEENKLPAGFIEYKNNELGFKFAYPEEWGNVQIEKLENSYQYKLTFTKSKNHSGLFEFGTDLYEGAYGEGKKYSAYQYRLRQIEKGLSSPITFNDGSSERWERMTSTNEGNIYAYCVYALGLEMVGKIGDGSKSLFIEENIDGGAYPTPSSCTKKSEQLSDQIGQSKINIFENILKTVRGI